MKSIKAIFANSAEMLVSFSNELAISDDGWAQIAPFGDFMGMAAIEDGKGGWIRERAIQRVDRKAVENMVTEYNASRAGIKKFLRGRPIFLGHPDSVVGGERFADKSPKGVFANVECRDTGFYGEPILTEEGERLVANKQVRALSGRWEAAEYVGEEMVGGRLMKVFRPTKFLSAGLVNKPNLPVEMFNEMETEQKENTVKKETVIALLASLGITTPKGATFANDASDEDVSEGLKKLGEKTKTLAADKAQFANEKATLENRIVTLTTEKQTAITERDTARAQFANERSARIGALLDGAVKEGRITAADRPTWENRLKIEAQFANEADALSKLNQNVKTKSITLERGDRKVEISNASDRREMVAELVSEEMAASKCDYDKAFEKIQKAHPQLFDAMAQPELNKRK